MANSVVPKFVPTPFCSTGPTNPQFPGNRIELPRTSAHKPVGLGEQALLTISSAPRAN